MSAPSLEPILAMELGSLSARATFQEPMVRLEATSDGPALLVLEEGGVRIDLELPDVDCVARLYRRIRREVLGSPANR